MICGGQGIGRAEDGPGTSLETTELVLTGVPSLAENEMFACKF